MRDRLLFLFGHALSRARSILKYGKLWYYFSNRI
jgi:hypothetical protein